MKQRHQPHPSQRGYFSYELHKLMGKNKNIWLVTVDLGYGQFDQIRDDYPDRFINTGVSEQSAMGIAVGLALKGKIPFVYSITPFLLYRPFETIRNYIDHEQIPVRLVGGGRDKDYSHDGFSHWAENVERLFYIEDKNGHNKAFFKNIQTFWPEEKEEIPEIVKKMVKMNKPSFISLKR